MTISPINSKFGEPADQTAARQMRLEVMDRVERRLSSFLMRERTRWSEVNRRGSVPVDAIADFVRAGGKRLRPAFCVTGFLAAGGEPASPAIADASAGLELVHVSALIHDDVLDDSPLRRGARTVHVHHMAEHAKHQWHGESRRFGEGIATIAGDLADVYAERLAAALRPRAREVWGELRTEVMVGQYLDVAVAAEFVVDPELSRWIAVCKSGRYTIHQPLVLGATIAGREDLAEAFEEYGAALGEAFQLRDDLIGAFGDSAAAGKPVGLDFEQHKMTLLLALAVPKDERVRELVTGGNWDPVKLRDLLLGIGVDEEVEQHIDALVSRACAAISRAPIAQAWKDELTEMAAEVAYRDR